MDAGRAALVLASLLAPGCGLPEQPGMDPEFPARDAPNYQGLVSAHWLKALLDGRDSGRAAPGPPARALDRIVVMEASWAPLESARDYHAGHVPGAIHLNTDDFETGSPLWRLREAGELQQAIGRLGITPETTVIVYGRRLVAAARVWWVLKYAGVADVRLLDGGFEAWQEAGYPVETRVQTPLQTSFSAPLATRLVATTEHVRERLQSPDAWIVDVRSEDEFLGNVSGYSYLEAKGRIPGAIHAGDGDDAAFLYKQRNGRLRPPAEILARWQEAGILPSDEGGRFEREVIFYCGGGWRSSVAFFYAWLLGFENIRNYSDGWSGWSTDYVRDPQAKGSTPGWLQQPTGLPIAAGPP